MRRSRLASAAVAVLLVPLVQVLPASTVGAEPVQAPVDDTTELTRKDFTLDGKPVETPSSYQPKAAKNRTAAAATPPVGTVRGWLGLDDLNGTLYRKDYTLRGVGNHIEVWVANDRAFPEGDCRLQ